MTAISRGLPGWFRRGKKESEPAAKETSGEPVGASVPLTGGEGETEPVVVWEASNRMEAEIVKGHLESEGIPAIITGDVAANIFGFHTGNLAKASVLVPAPLADRALEILETAVEASESEELPLPDDLTPDQTPDPRSAQTGDLAPGAE